MLIDKDRFRKFRPGESTRDVFALPAWKVKQLTGRAKSHHGDYFAPVKYKDNLEKLTKRVKLITRSTQRKKYTEEKFGEALYPSQAAKRRREGTLGYSSTAAAEQARKSPVGRQINTLSSMPDIETAIIPEGHNKGSLERFPSGYKRRAQQLLRKRLIGRERIDDGEWHQLRSWLHAQGKEALRNMIKESHYHRNEFGIIL